MATSPVRAVVGARVSIFTDGKESQITQRTKGTAYAESQGWTVVGTFEDLDVSAIKQSPWDRPDLRQWLTDRADDWDALIFAKTDRVFRSAADCVKLSEWCRDHKKILVLVDDGIKLDYFHPDSQQDAFAGAMSKVFLILASVFAEIEGQRFVQRALDRVTQYRHQPRWAYGVPPYGFQVVDRPEGGKALGHDLEAQRVLEGIATQLLSGDSLTRITSELNDAGVPSPADRLRQRAGKELRGSRWTVITVQTILTNPATQGIKTAKGKPVLDAGGEPVRVGPASFDPETWGRIHSELAQRSQSGQQRRHSDNPLLGVAKCGVCGKNMRHFQRTKGERHYRYYICGSTPKACPGVLINADNAEQAVETSFLAVHTNRRIKERVWRAGSDHSAELEQTTNTIKALWEDRALGLFTTPEDQDMFRSQMAALVAKRDALAQTPVIKAGWIDVETEQTYGAVWPDATPVERRKMLTDAGMKLTVYRANQYETYVNLDKAIGEGAVGEELHNELEARAADERRRFGIPD
ncbi:recombinase family protein [Mycobacteroides abscessus]|uniref:recombinase family protein n=1 Tax=Mycobacteroides abscessus TaxID=36809 RepID=UPI0009A5EDE5|nr:recombinase family protein [Mycobacteroides abscessus]SKN44911.1 phage Integrase [Mycobacteroides abscessus subsp. bolletii]SKX29973.1 phage Integrase [Mycobacteroides abscessus subsp. bolletii]